MVQMWELRLLREVIPHHKRRGCGVRTEPIPSGNRSQLPTARAGERSSKAVGKRPHVASRSHKKKVFET